MKLILCLKCCDIRRFGNQEWATCQCGKSAGKYLDDGWHSEVKGPCLAIGMRNDDLIPILKHPERAKREGPNLKAFVINEYAHTVKWVE